LAEDGPRRWALQQREAELLSAWRSEWVGEVRELVLAEEFRRGFVEGVTWTPQQLLERADEVFDLAPVRRLCLRGAYNHPGQNDEQLPALVAALRSPALARLTALRVELSLGADEVQALAEVPHLPRLAELHLSCPRIAEGAVRGLLE